MLKPGQTVLIADHTARHHLLGARVRFTWVLAQGGEVCGDVVDVQGRWAWVRADDGNVYARTIGNLQRAAMPPMSAGEDK